MYIRGFAVWFKQFAQHMPVYLITAHAYRSWSEGDPKGYVQRGEGLMPPSSALARYRARKAKHPKVRFEGEMQQVLNFVIESIVPEKGAKLHACVTCPTHVHILVSFRTPECGCNGAEYCARGCEAREFAEDVLVRLKRKMGQALAKWAGTQEKPWFSRGWDLTPVRKRSHFDHLVNIYLPQHEENQAGVFKKYS